VKTLNIPKIKFDKELSIDDAIDHMKKDNKDFTNNALTAAIIFGIENDMLKVPFMELLIGKKETLYTVKSHRDTWVRNLNRLSKYFIELEQYEKCGEIKKQLKKLY